MIKIPIEEKNEFLSQFTEFEKETFEETVNQPIEKIEAEYKDLLEELCLTVEMNGEEGKYLHINLIGLVTLLFNCANGDSKSI